MARSFANTKLAVSALIDGASLAINRSRGVSSMASQSVGSSSVVIRGGKSTVVVLAAKQAAAAAGEEKKEGTSSSSAAAAIREVSPWVPDPVTGYYRPENCTNEIDVAELRDMLLNHKMISHH